MKKSSRLLTFEKVFFILILIFCIGYFAYDRLTPSVKTIKPAPQPAPAIHANQMLQDSIVNFATGLLGTPYEAAGCSRDGFDCSGFVYFVFENFDIKVPRSSAGFEHHGKEIPIDEVRKGDLLLFLSPTRNVIGHIGIVSDAKGRNSDFIHASSGREMKVIISSVADDGYAKRFVKAVRVL